MKIKTLLLNGLLVIAAVVVSALFMEFATRMAFPAMAPSGQVQFVAAHDDVPALGPRDTRLRQVKNAGDFDVEVYFNKYGFRDTKDFAKSTPEDFFLVGDSLSFGWGVEETARYSNLVQQAIGRDVYNLCIPGDLDDFANILWWTIRNGAKVNNLMIAISMSFTLKDYENPSETEPAARQHGHLISIKNYLMTHSAFYFLVTSFIHKNEALRNIAVDLGLIVPAVEGIAYKPYSEKAIESTARRTQRLAKDYDAVVIIAPSRALWFGSEKEKETADRIHKAFIARLKELGLAVVDVRPDFERGGNPANNYFTNDGHWSPTGHAAAAHAVVRFLSARGNSN